MVLVAAITALSIDPDAASRTIFAAVDQKPANVPALLMALSFDHERATIAWLIKRLETKPPADQERAIVFSLRVLTEQTFATSAEWSAWWKASGPKFEPTSLDFEAQQGRMMAAATALKIDLLRDFVARTKSQEKTKGAAANQLSGMLEGMAATLEAGRNLRLSEAAKAGDEALARGDLQQAMADYATANDPGDVHSRYVRACLLLETGTSAAQRQRLTPS
jgi:hypothetical protein